MTYFNYLGQPMPETPAETGNISGTSAGNETITAPAGDTSVSGQGGGDLLIGSSGGNRFYLTDPRDRVQETAGGVDTEIGWLPIQLAPNVENLIVHGDFNHGVGNNLDNLITTDGRAWLDGGAGNDVLVGATNTTTTFVVRAGQGNDVIYNWQGADQLQLVGFDTTFKTASDIRAAMSQQGSDVVLNMGGGQSLTFRGVTLSTGFRDVQFLTPLDRSKLGSPTFTDDFNSLNLYDYSHKTGVWQTWFDGNNLKDIWAYSLPSNNEAQVYVSANYEGLGAHPLNINPFSINNGVLSITGQAVPGSESGATFGRVWASGMLNTLGTFQQKYGYFEVRAQVPDADGAWPAFWLTPWPHQPGQEGDVFEALGLQPGQDYRRAYGTDSYLFDNALKPDPSGWHTYGLLWTKDTLTYYLDGLEVLKGPTPASWTNPMGMILNMAMGGWGGEPVANQFPAQLNVDYVRAYALADGSTVVQTPTPTAPIGTLQDVAQPGGAPAAQTFTFDADGQPLSSGRIVVLDHDPAASELPAGRAFVVWQSSGQVRAAQAINGQLDPYTILMAGGSGQFTGAGTFLTDGRVVVGYRGADNGQPAAWALLFDPATRTFVQHELGPGGGQIAFTPMAGGDFAASWSDPGGGIDARTYAALAYDGKGWWAPVRDVAGQVSGVTADGDLIVSAGSGAKTVYDVVGGSAAVVGQVLTAPSGGGVLDAGGGPDTIQGADNGDNYIRGFGGDDRITGGLRYNQINGNLGSDSITGRSQVGDDLMGGQGNDTINASASSAHNRINGNKGDDSIVGGPVGDTLHGGQANDLIIGGAGNDWISGDLGQDTVTGGGGADIFRAFSGSGVMTVTDFHQSEGDRVQIDLGASYTVGQRGADTVIDVAGGGEVVLQNVQSSQLSTGWIFQA